MTFQYHDEYRMLRSFDRKLHQLLIWLQNTLSRLQKTLCSESNLVRKILNTVDQTTRKYAFQAFISLHLTYAFAHSCPWCQLACRAAKKYYTPVCSGPASERSPRWKEEGLEFPFYNLKPGVLGSPAFPLPLCCPLKGRAGDVAHGCLALF